MNTLVDLYPYRIREKECEFLVLKRAPGKKYAGEWRMVGGKVSDEEKSWEAALRELEEETGHKPIRFWSVPSLNHFYDYETDRVQLIPAFAAQLVEEQPIALNEEHIDYLWVPVDEVSNFIIWPEQLRLMKMIHLALAQKTISESWEIRI